MSTGPACTVLYVLDLDSGTGVERPPSDLYNLHGFPIRLDRMYSKLCAGADCLYRYHPGSMIEAIEHYSSGCEGNPRMREATLLVSALFVPHSYRFRQ